MTKPQTPDNDYLTPAEAAAQLRCDRQTVYKWLKDGTLTGRKIGPRKWLISASSLEKKLGR